MKEYSGESKNEKSLATYHVESIVLTTTQLALLTNAVNGNDNRATRPTKVLGDDAKGRVNVQGTTARELRNLRVLACPIYKMEEDRVRGRQCMMRVL